MVELSEEQIGGLTTAEQAIAALGTVLGELTGLLVLDNLETVHDAEVVKFLYQLPGRTRCSPPRASRWIKVTMKR